VIDNNNAWLKPKNTLRGCLSVR